jgi:hypothetical protein
MKAAALFLALTGSAAAFAPASQPKVSLSLSYSGDFFYAEILHIYLRKPGCAFRLLLGGG